MAISRATIDELVRVYDVDGQLAEKAFERLDDGTVFAFSFSGKIGSGKDTVGELVAKGLHRTGEKQPLQMFFAYPLKSELNQIIEIIKNSNGKEEASYTISKEMHCSLPEAAQIVTFIYKEVLEGAIINGYTRTINNRRALQYWGTEVRRQQEDLYWVKPIVKTMIRKLADGQSVFLTDTRFPNEAIGSLHAGASVIRLNVSEAEQKERILKRDGIVISEDSKKHTSETALDDFKDFTYTVQTDSYTSANDVAEAIVLLLNSK